MSFAIFELKCSACGVEYAQLLSESDENASISCPYCNEDLVKRKKLSGEDLIQCGMKSGSS
ncbi:MAG: zinc ribbon domain-containing protein [bacterium]|jgi:DNA-directed RNA polymerase subunit RPC12/RpoP